MALQPMIVASRGCKVDEFVAAFPDVDESIVAVGGGWRWFFHPGIGLDVESVERSLSSLPGPSLLVLAHEQAQWALRLYAQDREPFELVHTFGLLLPLEDDPLGPIPDDDYVDDWDILREQEGPQDAFDSSPMLRQLRDLARSLPDGGEDDFAIDDPDAFRMTLLRSQAERLVEALRGLAIPHHAQQVEEVMTGHAVTPAELGSRLGNAPRLLLALGFGEAMEKWLAELTPADEQGDAWDAEWDGEVAEETFSESDLSSALQVDCEPIEDGPRELPLRRFHHLIRAGLWCEDESVARVALTYPEETHRPALADDYARVHERSGSVETLVYDHPSILASPMGRPFRKALSQIPDGTELDITVAHPWDEGPRPTRWRGAVEEGVWRITHSSIEVPAHRWAEFVELMDRMFIDEPVPCRSLDEQERVLERLSSVLSAEPGSAEVVGEGIRATPWTRSEVVMHLFRLRYGDIWDTEEADSWDLDLAESLRGFHGYEEDDEEGVTLDSVFASRGETLLEGDYCEVHRADLDDAPGDAQHALDVERRSWEAQGMRHLGEVVVSAVPTAYCSCYVSPDRLAYGVSYVDVAGSTAREFHSRTDDGRLLSTVGPGEWDDDLGFAPGGEEQPGLTELWEKHQRTVADASPARPVRLEPGLREVATALDEHLGSLLWGE